jgi:AAA domain (dynein-related subfamily)
MTRLSTGLEGLTNATNKLLLKHVDNDTTAATQYPTAAAAIYDAWHSLSTLCNKELSSSHQTSSVALTLVAAKHLLSTMTRSLQSMPVSSAIDCLQSGIAAMYRLVATIEQEQANTVNTESSSSSDTTASTSGSNSRFQWTDGVLVKALEAGHWILLENSNYCSASVLDRLNPLLETGGELLLTECGTTSGKLRVINPHPNFRLFLTCDPQSGEVSRSMRNRCLEICLLDTVMTPSVINQTAASSDMKLNNKQHVVKNISSISNDNSSAVVTRDSLIDVTAVIHNLGGVMSSSVISVMLDVHRRVTTNCTMRGLRLPSVRDLLRWSELITQQLSRGIVDDAEHIDEITVIMAKAFALACNGSGGLAIISNVEAVIHAALQDTVTIENQFTNQLVLVQDCMSDISDIARYRCMQNARLSAYITANKENGVINTQHNTADTSIASLLSHAVTNIIALCQEKSGSAIPTSESFAVALRKCVNSATGSDLLPYVLATYARESSAFDRQLRAHYTPSECTAAVSTMLTALYDGTAWKACATVLQTFQDVSDTTDTKAAIAFMQSPWTPMIPITDNDLWVTAQQQLQHPTSNTTHITTTLQKFNIAVASRLPVILSEELCVIQAKQQLQAPRISEQGMSWLTISCLAHFDANKRKKVSGSGDTHTIRTNIVPHFYTLLVTTDTILAQCVSIAVVEPSLISAVTGPRDDLSVLLSTSQPTAATATASTANTSVATVAQFGWDKFIVAWRWYKAAILKVNKILMDTSLHSSINEQLEQSILDIQSLCARIDIGVAEFGGVGTLSNGGDILWKYGQHPSLPANTAHAQALAELHTLSGSYAIAPVSTTDGNSSDSSKSINLVDFLKASHPVLSIPLALRWDLLLGTTTLHHAVTDEWSDRSVNTNSVNSTNSDADIQTLLRLPDTLKAATQKAQRLFEETHKGTRLIGNGSSDSTSSGTIGGIEQDAMLAFDSEDQASLVAIAEASIVVIGGSNDGNSSNSGVLDRWAHVQLIPLVQHWAAVEELNIISELVAIGNDDTVTSYDTTTELAAVMRRMKQLIRVQIENTLAAPTELRPYQMLVWAYDSATATVSSSSNSSVSNSQALDKLLHVLLPRVLPLMLQSWGDRVSSNLYNDVDAVCSKLEPPSIIPIQFIHDTIGSESATTLQYNGAPRLLQCVRSAVVLKLLQGDVTVMNAPARLRQCQTAISHVLQLSYSGSNSISGSVQSLQQLAWGRLLHTVQAFEDIFANSEHYDEAISSLQQCFTSSHTNDVSMSDSAQQQQQQQSLLQQVSATLYKCTNSRLTAIISSLILPAIEALMMSAVGVSTTQQQQLVHVSTAVALIGVIRLSLLLPSTPVDPGQAPAAKQSLLQVRLNSCALDFTAQQLSRYISCGGILSSSMCEQLHEAQRLHSACIALSKRAVVRPSAAAAATTDGNNSQSFRKLFSELHTFGSKVGSIQRVTTLLTALADSSSNSSTGSSKDSIAKAVALCQEERVWQDTSHAFINRLHSDYTDFGDITAPICEAITFIRTGLRLLASTLDITTHSTTGTDIDEVTVTKNNLIKFLLQYPYTPSSTGNVTDIHAEMHETQAVVSGSDRVKKVAVLQVSLFIHHIRTFINFCSHCTSLNAGLACDAPPCMCKTLPQVRSITESASTIALL